MKIELDNNAAIPAIILSIALGISAIIAVVSWQYNARFKAAIAAGLHEGQAAGQTTLWVK